VAERAPAMHYATPAAASALLMAVAAAAAIAVVFPAAEARASGKTLMKYQIA